MSAVETKQVLVADWLMSFSHLNRLMKALNKRTAKHLGFYYEVIDCGGSVYSYRPKHWSKDTHHEKVYADYPGSERGCYVRVYRDIVIKPLQLSKSFSDEVNEAHWTLKKWLNEELMGEVDRQALATILTAYDILARK